MTDIREFMVIVYDADDIVFPRHVRVAAAQTVLGYLKREDGWRFLPDACWEDPNNGRVAYLIGIILYLPGFHMEAEKIVSKLYTSDEQRAFFQMFRQFPNYRGSDTGYA